MNIQGFEFPDDCWVLPEWDTWARVLPDGLVEVGITSLGVELSGELYMCRPKSVGNTIEQAKSIAVVELAKSVVSVKCPVAGVVVEVNSLLEDQPQWPYKDPYGKGWLARLQVDNWPSQCAALLQGDALRQYVEHRMHLFRVAPRANPTVGGQA